jgi:hypothetical protein
MRIATSLFLLACATCSSGCSSHGTQNGVVPPFNPPSPIASTVVDYTIVAGLANTTVDVANPGMAITTSGGGNWRATWVGNSDLDFISFRGYIYTPGTFITSTPGCSDGSCTLEAGDTLSLPNDVAAGGQEILFDTQALDSLDGLDFAVDSVVGEPVVFYLEVQYIASPLLVFFNNGDRVSPLDVPFGLH